MKRLVAISLLFLATTAVALPPQAQTPSRPVPAPNGKSGFRTDFLSNLDDVQEKIMELATAVPADRYGWRPGEGVRSISEVYMHIAGGNYFLATFVGKQPPADIPKDLERITDKAKVLAELRRSFDHLRAVAMAESEADLDKSVRMYGTQTTHRGVLLTALTHLHEHLGQSIAYARTNGVVPPWSR